MASTVKKNKLQQLKMEQEVYELLMMGWTNKNIISELIEKHGYQHENAQKIITKVLKDLVPIEQNTVDELKVRYLNMFYDIYSRAVDASEWRTANEILKSIVKLQGLDVQKLEAKVDSDVKIDLTNVSDDKLDELINKLTINNEIDG